MRYDKLSEMIRTIAREKLEENIKIRSSSRSHSMAGRYSRRKGEIRLAQEEEKQNNTGTTDTGNKANAIDVSPVIIGSINQTR